MQLPMPNNWQQQSGCSMLQVTKCLLLKSVWLMLSTTSTPVDESLYIIQLKQDVGSLTWCLCSCVWQVQMYSLMNLAGFKTLKVGQAFQFTAQCFMTMQQTPVWWTIVELPNSNTINTYWLTLTLWEPSLLVTLDDGNTVWLRIHVCLKLLDTVKRVIFFIRSNISILRLGIVSTYVEYTLGSIWDIVPS